MSKIKEKVIYCAFCGTKNDIKNENCSKCKKTLHPKNRLFRDFLYDHIKDNLKGKVEDTFFSYLKNFIISNLYGLAMTVSVVFAATTIIAAPKAGYTKVSSTDDIKNKANNGNEVTIRVYTYDDMCSDAYDAPLAGVPFAYAGVITGKKRTMQEITITKGTSISDYCKEGHETELICAEPVSLLTPEEAKKIDEAGKKYRKEILAYAKWANETGDIDSDEYAKRNMDLEELSYDLIPEDLEEYDKNKTIKQSTDLFIALVGCDYEVGE